MTLQLPTDQRFDYGLPSQLEAGVVNLLNSLVPGIESVPALVSGTGIPVLSSRSIAANESGSLLWPAAGVNLTVPAGLTPKPSISFDCPATGSVTITPGVGVLINNSGAPITRSRANNPVGFILVAHQEENSYGLSGI